LGFTFVDSIANSSGHPDAETRKFIAFDYFVDLPNAARVPIENVSSGLPDKKGPRKKIADNQGCQIFLGLNIPKQKNIYQMTANHAKRL
jgi:hypothetical protein